MNGHLMGADRPLSGPWRRCRPLGRASCERRSRADRRPIRAAGRAERRLQAGADRQSAGGVLQGGADGTAVASPLPISLVGGAGSPALDGTASKQWGERPRCRAHQSVADPSGHLPWRERSGTGRGPTRAARGTDHPSDGPEEAWSSPYGGSASTAADSGIEGEPAGGVKVLTNLVGRGWSTPGTDHRRRTGHWSTPLAGKRTA